MQPFWFAALETLYQIAKEWLEKRTKKPLPHWRDMDYKYLEAWNELNVMCPTETEEEKGLARYLEFNSEEDHVRRQHKNQESPEPRRPVTGSWSTLCSPGLSQLSSGGLAGLSGGVLGGLGAAGYGAANQQQLNAAQQGYMNAQLQQSVGLPGTADNNINLLAQQSGQHGFYLDAGFGIVVDNSDLMNILDNDSNKS